MGKEKLNTLALFSGGGGLDLGFAAAGFRILLSVDNDYHSCETLKVNTSKNGFFHNHKVACKDIHNLTAKKIETDFGIKTSDINVVIGGPPCQAFSVAGRRNGLNDPRGNLVWEYIRIIKEVDPELFVFENVSGLKSIHGGKLFEDIKKSLSCNGKYIVSDHTYDVVHYGVPQFRTRIFFIGSKKKIVPDMIQTHGDSGSLFQLNPLSTVKQVLSDMPEPGDKENGIPNHKGRKHSQRIIDRYRSLKFGERDHKTRINKLDPERPSFTIIVGSDAGGGKGHVHPWTPREVTPRESARIQTFPDWWEFSGTGRHVIRQVGNAVPPLFAMILGYHIKKYVFKSDNALTFNGMIKKLGLDYFQGVNLDIGGRQAQPKRREDDDLA